MGVAEIIGFAVCWLLVAALMLWGVFTEHRRGAPPEETALEHPSSSARVPRAYNSDWVVVEKMDGTSAEVAEQARFLAGAWLAARGVDMSQLPASDMRTEVISSADGTGTTRVVVRAGALAGSRREG